MEYQWRKATIDDIDLLVKTRIMVLRNANSITERLDLSVLVNNQRRYYAEALKNNTHTAYLIFDEHKLIGSGDIAYYQIMPTYYNQTGNKGYIMNMYTKPEYRRMGIATRTLDLLIKDAHNRGVFTISLEATEMGKLLYKKYGFIEMQNEMVYI